MTFLSMPVIRGLRGGEHEGQSRNYEMIFQPAVLTDFLYHFCLVGVLRTSFSSLRLKSASKSVAKRSELERNRKQSVIAFKDKELSVTGTSKTKNKAQKPRIYNIYPSFSTYLKGSHCYVD